MSKILNFKIGDELEKKWFKVRKFSKYSLSEIVRKRLEEVVEEEKDNLIVYEMGVEYGEKLVLSVRELKYIGMILKSYSRYKNVDVKEMVGMFILENKVNIKESRVWYIGVGEGVINNLNDEVVR